VTQVRDEIKHVLAEVKLDAACDSVRIMRPSLKPTRALPHESLIKWSGFVQPRGA
jgi:hypothetical protein